MNSSFLSELDGDLRSLEAMGRLRACVPLSGTSRSAPDLDGRPVLSFSSNDYLGLADHPALARAATQAAARSGFGAGSSRLLSGDMPEHRALEEALADLVAAEAALLFPTGYQANLGVFSALAGPEDLVVSDAANHASLIDGCRLSRARIVVYPHRDTGAAETAIASGAGRRRFLVTESLFSMDGDIAPLSELATIAARHRAALIVDEAHALGVMGPGGRGLCHAAGVRPDVLVGTLGKAFGAMGGFVAGARALRDVLVNRARTFMFTTAPPPPLAAAALAGVELARGPDGDARRGSLRELSSNIADLLDISPFDTPIFPIAIGADRDAIAAAMNLRAQGLFVPAIRPPTVPEGTARLRISLSARHSLADLGRLAAALRALGLPSA